MNNGKDEISQKMLSVILCAAFIDGIYASLPAVGRIV